MIFTELRFIILIVATWLAFFSVPPRFRPHTIVVSGVVFYALFAALHAPLILALILCAYVLSAWAWNLALIVLVAIVLAYFKLSPSASGLTAMGVSPTAAVIPLGISFLAFELMHFAIERRRGAIASDGIIHLSAFALFFPCRVAGPIKRYKEFTCAVAAAEPSVDNVYRGVLRILVGIVKKVVVADFLALIVMERSYAVGPLHVWKVVLAYSFQLFFDFSAYSDMAIGSSRVLGISVSENFDWPYLAPNIQDFWNRWHMSLSSWVRDYVFAPFGRLLFQTSLRRRAMLIATFTYLATFLVIGAWHGLRSRYLVWGLYHGALLSAFTLYRRHVPSAWIDSSWYQSRAAEVGGVLVTFLLVTIGWVPFMADWPDAWRMLRTMFFIS